MGKNRFEEYADNIIDIRKEAAPEAQEWTQDLTQDIDYIIPFDCVARDIQKWILETSKYPQPAIAYAAALCVVGTAIGRSIRYEDIKGNLMFICTAESGEGKDYPFKCSQNLLDAIGMANAKAFKQASGASFIDHLAQNPSTLFYIDEFGNYLESISGKKSSAYASEITGYLTEIYTSASGPFTGKSAVTNPAKTIEQPNVCLLGLTTERQIFDGLRTSDIANGSISRYSVLFGRSKMMPLDVRHNSKPPQAIVDRLIDLRSLYDRKTNSNDNYESLELDYQEHYCKEKYALELFFKSLSIKNFDKGYAPVYNRAAVRTVQQAMLIDQCQDVSVLSWVKELEVKSIDLFCKKFNHLGSDNENERQSKLLISKIKEAGTKGIKARDLTRKTQQLTARTRLETLTGLLKDDLIFKTEESHRGGTTIMYFWKK